MDHLDEGPDHEVIEIDLIDHKLTCHKLAERREELEVIGEEEME